MLDRLSDGGWALLEGFLAAFQSTDFATGIAGLVTLYVEFAVAVGVLRHSATVTAVGRLPVV
jgi:hypothetical protein